MLTENPFCCCSIYLKTFIHFSVFSATIDAYCPPPEDSWIGGHTEPHLAPVSSMNS